MIGYQLRVTLYRGAGSGAPRVTRLGAVVADDAAPYAPSATPMTTAIDLGVPPYSQEIHAGHYPQFDGGGEAWCSPTSTSMVVDFWGRGPTPPTSRGSTPTTRTRPVGRLRGALHVRLQLQRHRQLAVQHRVRGTCRARRRSSRSCARSPRPSSSSRRASRSSRRSRSARAARRLPLQGDERPSADDRRLHRVGRRRLERPGRAQRRRRAAHVYDRAQFEKAWMELGGLVFVLATRRERAFPARPGAGSARRARTRGSW